MKRFLLTAMTIFTIVSGIPFSVSAAECSHSNTEIIQEKEPSCTANGYSEGVYCNDCHKYIKGHNRINPTGHFDENNDHVCDVCREEFHIHKASDPTCTTDGYTGDKEENGHIIMGKIIPATGHKDTNADYICDACGSKIDKKDITIRLHYYVLKEDYEANKKDYTSDRFSVKTDCNISTCVYVTEKIKAKQGEELEMPDIPQLARYDFQWVDRQYNTYQKFVFHKNTELYMVYNENTKEKPYGQAGDDAYWSYLKEENILYFYGRGKLWNHYDSRTDLPWYEYLMKAEKVEMDGGISATAWTVMKHFF